MGQERRAYPRDLIGYAAKIDAAGSMRRADVPTWVMGGLPGSARHNGCMSRPRSHHPARLNGACPCGLAATYGDCCGRLHRGQARAATPEQLMRSRFSAYAVHDEPYLLRTWHPATRPAARAGGDHCTLCDF